VAIETAPVDTESTTTDQAPSDPTTVDASAGAAPTAASPPVVARPAPGSMGRTDKMPIKMLNDRILVRMSGAEGERRSNGGILIPATAQMGKRLTWAEVVAVGPNVRSVEEGDQVLFNPEDRYEVDVRGEDLIILRERDVHAVASPRLAEGSTGLYL
jgi:chaperonin GroES